MRSSTILSSAVAAVLSFSNAVNAVTGEKGDAPVINTNPNGLKFFAEFTNTSTVQGSISFLGRENGTGVTVNVSLHDFPSSGGPFLYHIHQYPLAADGNCASAGAHLDPYVRGEQPPCNASAPETCQVGDLSGKHGKIPIGSDPFSTMYIDDFISTDSSTNAYVGGLSVVIHLNSTTRIACANITLPGATTVTGGNTTTGGNVSTTMSMPSATAITNAGSSVKVGALIMGSVMLVLGAAL